MPVEVKVPSVGESITEGSIARWLKKDGELVTTDEPLFELETEKASTEVPAPASGKLRITVPEGEKVDIGAVVGSIHDDASAPGPSKPAQTSPNSDGAVKQPPPSAEPQRVAGKKEKEQVRDRQPAPAAAATPAPAPPKPAAAPTGERETRRRMSAIRQRIADRLVQAQKSTASLTTFNEADLSAIIDLRTRYKDRFKEKHEIGLGFMSFFVKAAVEALKAYPVVNSRIDGDEIVTAHFYDIGVAVSTDKGLMVPVLHDADHMSFADIEKTLAQLAAKARDGKLAVSDLQGGTFTITNGGIFGSMLSTPILNPPQSAILGMHAIQKRPVARDAQVVIRPMMYLALSYDHRLVDGRDAVLFLIRIKECIENPERLLLDI